MVQKHFHQSHTSRRIASRFARSYFNLEYISNALFDLPQKYIERSSYVYLYIYNAITSFGVLITTNLSNLQKFNNSKYYCWGDDFPFCFHHNQRLIWFLSTRYLCCCHTYTLRQISILICVSAGLIYSTHSIEIKVISMHNKNSQKE